MNAPIHIELCRLCCGDTELRYSKRLIDRHDVRFMECRSCGSLQAEKPYWLGECYSQDVSPADGLYLTRNLHSYSRVSLVCALLGLPKSAPILDFGGGLGVTARLLTEDGRRAYSEDAFSKSPFGVDAPAGLKPTLVTAFEVFEHLTDPAEDLMLIFKGSPDFVLVGTELYHKQESDWPYLSTESGQHVFFYSPAAMRLIGERFGYQAVRTGARETLFSRVAVPAWKILAMRLASSGPLTRLLCAWRVFWLGRPSSSHTG